jgi:hypothetical protein
MHEKLKTQLAELRLHGMERVLEAEIERTEREGMSTFSLFDGTLNRLFEVVPESGSGVLLERTGTGAGNRLSGGI